MVVTTIVVGYVLFLLTRHFLYRPQRPAALLIACMLVGAAVDVGFVSNDLLRTLHAKAHAHLASYGPVPQ